jgi:MFS transporter, DHA3 family, macrolide efflux protein
MSIQLKDEPEIESEARPARFLILRLLRNRAWTLLWGGKAISTMGDVFFNLAVMWVVYAQSGSALQTAFVQVIWQVSSVIFGPLAGSWADLKDRKRIMVGANLLAGMVVVGVALTILLQRQILLWEIYVAVFVLNSLNTFLAPATFSVLPEIVEKDLLVTSSGWFATAQQVTGFIGSALAGGVIALVGMIGSVLIDAASFFLAAFSVVLAPLPNRSNISDEQKKTSMWRAFLEGWRAMQNQPVIKTLVWLAALANVVSFMGPLMPALVHLRLHGGAATYGLLDAVSIIGGVAGGLLAGGLGRRLGVGRQLALSWAAEGLCILGLAFSTALPLAILFQILFAFSCTLGNVVLIALLQSIIPGEFRGRIFATAAGLSVLIIPFSALAGGWLADRFGPAPLFAFAGIWLIGLAAVAWTNHQIRTASL